MARPTTPPVGLAGPTKLLINGEWLEPATGRHYDDINPSTGEVLASIAEGGAEDVDRAVKAARAAFQDGAWSHLHASERGRLLYRLVRLVAEHSLGQVDITH